MSRGHENPNFNDLEMADLSSDMERNLKPLFDRHGTSGILISDLRREMKGKLVDITEDRVLELLRKADYNDNDRITYTEFTNSLKNIKEPERARFRVAVRYAVTNVIPKRAEKGFLSHYTCCPPPVFMIVVSIAELITFGVYAAELAGMDEPVTASSGVPMYSPLVFKPNKRHEVWRFLTYMLIHQGWLHILFNVLFQLLFGIPLEMIHKWWRVMVLYLCGVLAGSLAHSMLEPTLSLVGASGGGYAIIGAHIASVAMNWKEMNLKCCDRKETGVCRFLGNIMVSAPMRLAICLGLFIPDTSLAIYRRVSAPHNDRVGVAAHVAGFLTGLLLGLPVVKNMDKTPPEEIARWVTLAAFLLFVVVAILFNGLYDGYPAADFT